MLRSSLVERTELRTECRTPYSESNSCYRKTIPFTVVVAVACQLSSPRTCGTYIPPPTCSLCRPGRPHTPVAIRAARPALLASVMRLWHAQRNTNYPSLPEVCRKGSVGRGGVGPELSGQAPGWPILVFKKAQICSAQKRARPASERSPKLVRLGGLGTRPNTAEREGSASRAYEPSLRVVRGGVLSPCLKGHLREGNQRNKDRHEAQVRELARA